MCHWLRFSLVALTMLGTAMAQEIPSRVANAAPPASGTESYFIQLVEFRMKAADHNLTSEEIAKTFDHLLKEKKVEVIEHVRVAALENYESMIQSGKSKTVTTSLVRTPQGQQRSQATIKLGTIIRLTPKKLDGGVLVKLEYEASRMDGEEPEEGQPESTNFMFGSTCLVESGKPLLLGGSTAGNGNYLLLKIDSK